MTVGEGVFPRTILRQLMGGQCSVDRAFRRLDLAIKRIGSTPTWDTFVRQAEDIETAFEEHREIYDPLAAHAKATGHVIAMGDAIDRYHLAGELLWELDELAEAFVLTLHARLFRVRDLLKLVYETAETEGLQVTRAAGAVDAGPFWDLGNFLKHADEWPAELTEARHRRTFDWFKQAGLVRIEDGAREFEAHLTSRALMVLSSTGSCAAAIGATARAARERGQEIVRQVERDFEPHAKILRALRAKARDGGA